MEPRFITKYSVFLLIVSLLSQAYTSRCCLEHEKVALLQLKSYFMSLSNLADFKKSLSNELSSWEGDGEGDCCLWNRVTCSRSMQHVTELSLHALMDAYEEYNGSIIEKPNVLNVSLFQPFENLISLDLSWNGIHRLVGNEGNKTSSLRNLEILNFENNELQLEEVANLVKSLTSLKKLALNFNRLAGIFSGQEVAHLEKLQVLDLSTNSLNGSLPALGSMKGLQVLNLSSNNFDKLNADEDFCKLRNLQELKLDKNLLSGSIPRCLWNFTSLRVLDLSQNSFSGNLPPYINLPSLQLLSIYNNNFQGRFLLCYQMNLSKLEGLFLSYNSLQVEVDHASCPSTFKLVGLGLSRCSLGRESNDFFKFLSYQSNIEYADLSSNGLIGSFPVWFLGNNSNLKYLNLRNNSIAGSLELPKHSNLSLSHFDVSSNKLKGKIPEKVGMVLSELGLLNMSLNTFDGHIPSSIGNMKLLFVLDLSDNNLFGEVPEQLLSNCTSLEILLLSKNTLQGEIIPSYMNLPSLQMLSLDSNDFVGTIKMSLSISTDMMSLDISSNKATGELPSWIDDLGFLKSLSLGRNGFHGAIPSQLCNIELLDFLDLSENKFTGEVPSCDKLLSLRFLHMHGNHLTGAIPKGLSKLSALVTLDLRNNNLSGGIPRWINKLSNLVILLLGGNQLEGELPVQLCRLQHINIINLSNNNISGAVPTCFRNLSFGALKLGDLYLSLEGTTEIWPWNNNGYLTWPMSEIIELRKREEVEFIVKSRYSSYMGNILAIMSELDLSGNRLNGCIPLELGELGKIHAMNLSHNRFSGSIPESFSKLESIESLDLSSNNLSGTIPFELVDLTFLEIFNVSYNNLSGEVPEVGQFGSFDESNYQGNPLLCGSRLPRRCRSDGSKPNGSTSTDEEAENEGTRFDMEVFLWSFSITCVIVLVAFVAVLAINPYWRRAWFAFIDVKFLWWFLP